MDCTTCREILSARFDGEETEDEVVGAEAHLAGCAGCQAFLVRAEGVHRLVRVQPAERVPDLTNAIVAAAYPLPRWRAVDGYRVALLAVGLLLFFVALPAVVHQGGAMNEHHLTRELAAFEIALAVGLLVAAWQPGRAVGMLPMAGALGAVLLTIAIMDLTSGMGAMFAEGQHLLEVAGLGLLWVVARTGADRPVPRFSAA